jgi:hypothetical protein
MVVNCHAPANIVVCAAVLVILVCALAIVGIRKVSIGVGIV